MAEQRGDKQEQREEKQIKLSREKNGKVASQIKNWAYAFIKTIYINKNPYALYTFHGYENFHFIQYHKFILHVPNGKS